MIKSMMDAMCGMAAPGSTHLIDPSTEDTGGLQQFILGMEAFTTGGGQKYIPLEKRVQCKSVEERVREQKIRDGRKRKEGKDENLIPEWQ